MHFYRQLDDIFNFKRFRFIWVHVGGSPALQQSIFRRILYRTALRFSREKYLRGFAHATNTYL